MAALALAKRLLLWLNSAKNNFVTKSAKFVSNFTHLKWKFPLNSFKVPSKVAGPVSARFNYGYFQLSWIPRYFQFFIFKPKLLFLKVDHNNDDLDEFPDVNKLTLFMIFTIFNLLKSANSLLLSFWCVFPQKRRAQQRRLWKFLRIFGIQSTLKFNLGKIQWFFG